ncbi:hypothetical protein [Chitinophaga sp. Cy-1792]|uniref:hypothetical protein n=1 Tax=Chitinophaga sp. Cy-1792 TaxID=2608339 RepID=UPI00142017D4|nr:hypothetical protein [Chitinophaga sp. Cy-1792]NIG51911.1 hypothetical protein [Chitinophaga sp. Cy-1792]
MPRLYLFLLLLIMLYSCNHKPGHTPEDSTHAATHRQNEATDTVSKRLADYHILTNEKGSGVQIQVLDSPPSFLHSVIRIKEYKVLVDARLSSLDTTADAALYEKCKKWKLDSATMVRLIRHAEAADARFIDERCDVMPAQIVGFVLIDGVEHQFFINAGSNMIIFRGHIRGNYVWTVPQYQKYFVLPVPAE